MFYLVDTYDYLREKFPDIRFLFENHVTEPYHMSVQNLPIKTKEHIKTKIDFYLIQSLYIKNVSRPLGTDS